MKKPRFVYFIKPVGMDGPIKIGCSDVPENRLEQLGVWSPFPLELMGHVPGCLADEQFLHDCFADLYSHREWFFSSRKLHEIIGKIIAGGSVDCVRGEINPAGNIRKQVHRRGWTDNMRSRASYCSRVRHLEARLRKQNDRWYAPADVKAALRAWHQSDKSPSAAEIARIDAFLSDPARHAVTPPWLEKEAA